MNKLEQKNKQELKDFIIEYGYGVRDIARAIKREPSGVYKWLNDDKGMTLCVWYEIRTYMNKVIKQQAK
jgi:DNA transposition AAA+ family ATPase